MGEAPDRNKKHTCPYCKEKFYKCSIGAHLFKAHPDKLKWSLSPYKTFKPANIPVTLGDTGYFVCMCCKDVWTAKGRVLNHMKTSQECTAEKQFQQLYLFLGCDMPHSVKYNLSGPQEFDKIKIDTLNSIVKQRDTTITNLQSQLHVLSTQKHDRTEKHRLEAKVMLAEYERHIETELLKEKLKMLMNFVVSKDQELATKRINEIVHDEDELNRLEQLKVGVDYEFKHIAEPKKVVIQEVVPVKPEPPKIIVQIPKPVPVPKPQKPKPIKEEIEDWHRCENCEDPVYTFLRTCTVCDNKTCIENDLTGCYHYECRQCQKFFCSRCQKNLFRKNIGNRMKLYCSSKCMIANQNPQHDSDA